MHNLFKEKRKKLLNKIHNWLNIVVIKDTLGPKEVTKRLEISFKAMGALDSFVERTVLNSIFL